MKNNPQPSPALVLDFTGDIAYHLKTALKALDSMKPRTKMDVANVAWIRAQLEYAGKLNQGLHNVASETISKALDSMMPKE